jgi:hypothetical protein
VGGQVASFKVNRPKTIINILCKNILIKIIILKGINKNRGGAYIHAPYTFKKMI